MITRPVPVPVPASTSRHSRTATYPRELQTASCVANVQLGPRTWGFKSLVTRTSLDSITAHPKPDQSEPASRIGSSVSHSVGGWPALICSEFAMR